MYQLYREYHQLDKIKYNKISIFYALWLNYRTLSNKKKYKSKHK